MVPFEGRIVYDDARLTCNLFFVPKPSHTGHFAERPRRSGESHSTHVYSVGHLFRRVEASTTAHVRGPKRKACVIVSG